MSPGRAMHGRRGALLHGLLARDLHAAVGVGVDGEVDVLGDRLASVAVSGEELSG